jgi:tyrosinase
MQIWIVSGVWTRKQQSLKLPYLPSGEELDSLSKEPFLFYVNGNGQYVGESHAGDYLSTDRFQYDYQPGFGENMLEPQNAGLRAKRPMAALNAVIKHNQASVAIPSDAIRSHLSSGLGASLVVAVTMPRPSEVSAERDFDVLVGAPSDVDQAGPESPYYAGTIAFFGKMASMGMEGNATFAVPLPKSPEAFHNFAAAANAQVNIRVVPSHNQNENAPVLKAVSVQAL